MGWGDSSPPITNMMLVHSTYFRNDGGRKRGREEIKRGEGGRRKIQKEGGERRGWDGGRDCNFPWLISGRFGASLHSLWPLAQCSSEFWGLVSHLWEVVSWHCYSTAFLYMLFPIQNTPIIAMQAIKYFPHEPLSHTLFWQNSDCLIILRREKKTFRNFILHDKFDIWWLRLN